MKIQHLYHILFAKLLSDGEFSFLCCGFDDLWISSSCEIFLKEALKFFEHDWAWIVYGEVGCVDPSIIEKIKNDKG